MKKRALALLLVICTLFQLLPVTAYAATVVDSGKCGDNATWKLTSDGTLTISGTGAMKDYNTNPPWESIRDSITSAIISNGITHIGNSSFYYCKNLTSVKIPDSVTTIGDWAFTTCESLRSVSFGSNVTSLGRYVFANSGLNTVTIPENITSIDECAFYSCTNLTEIDVSPKNSNYSSDSSGVLFNKNKTELIQAPCAIIGDYSIPNGVISVSEKAFDNCLKLTGLTVPRSVELIGQYAFDGLASCSKFSVDKNNAYYSSDSSGVLFNKQKTHLLSVPARLISGSYSVPNGVTNISRDAFSACRRLTSITIPESVTFIGSNAFAWCSALTNLFFHGNAPSFQSTLFTSDITATAYYPSNNTTWTTDVMEFCSDLATITWVPYANQVSWKGNVQGYTVMVSESASSMNKVLPIEGVKVTLTDLNAINTGFPKAQGTTNDKGQALFQTMVVRPEPIRLWIEKDGYKTIQTVVNFVRNDGSAYVMEKAPNDKPYLTCTVVTYQNGGTKYTDLRYDPLGVAEGDTKTMTTMFHGNWNGYGTGKYMLYQDNPELNSCKVLYIDSGGKLTFSPGKEFKEGQPIYMQMIAKDGTKSEPVKLDLRIYSSDAMLNDVAGPGTMEWLTDQKLESDHEIFRTIMQMPLSISAEVMGLEVEMKDNKDSFELEVVLADSVVKEKASIKNAKTEIKKLSKIDDISKVAKELRKSFSKSTKVRSMATYNVDGGVYLYAKYNKTTNKVDELDSGFLAAVDGKVTAGKTWVLPVGLPVFVEFNLAASAKIYGTFTKEQIETVIRTANGNKAKIKLPVPVYDEDLSEIILPSVSVEAGAGVRSLMTVGVGGKLKHKIMMGTKANPYMRGECTANLFFHAYLMHVVNYTYDFAKSEPFWKWPEKAKNLALYSSGQTDLLADEDDTMTLVSRDYLNETSEWVGMPVTMLNEGNALATLQSGVMPDVIPQIHTVGDKQIMLFLRDSGARSIGNHTQLVYSVLENGSWSEPVPVWESETADIYFDSAVEGDKLCVVWQKSDTVLDETEPEALLNAMAASSEIAYAQWDNERSCFVNQQFLTDNDRMDLMASVAMDGGDAVVVWATTGTDVLGGTGDCTLNQIRVEDGVAGTPEELCTTDRYIVELAAGVTGEGVQAAWITSETDGTSDLYRFADGAPELVAEEGNFAGLSFHKDSFMVQNNGALYSFAPATGEMAQLLGEDMAVSSSYQYVRNGETESVVWYRSGETGNLMASVYSDGAWQAPVVLLDEITDNITFMDAAVNAYGQYLVVANTADFTENGAENTALKFTCITPAKELELVGASVYDADWENNTQEINLLLENTGFFPISEVTVEVTAGDTVCLSKTISVDLQSGESCDITEMLDITGIETLIDADGRVTAEGDTDETNNTDVVTLGYADVSLEVDPMIYGDYEIFILKAANASNTDANVTLTVREDDAEGAVVETIDLGVVTAEGAVQYWYSVDASAIDFGDSDHKTYYFSISTDVEDLSDLDDSCLGVVDMPAGDGILPDDAEIEEIVVVEPERVEILNGDIVIPGVESEGTQLEVQVTPDEETGVDWYAEDSSVVHVTSDGFVIPLNPGTTTVTAAVSEEIFDTITVTVEAAAHVHTEEIVEGIEATCTENGLTDGCICSVCLETLSEHRVIPAAGHSISGDPTFVWAEDYSTCNAVRTCGTCGGSVGVACEITSSTTPATENKAGATVYTATAELDGKTYTDTKTVVIPATGHVKHVTTLVPENEATCTDPGNTVYYTCSGCDVWFEDAEATVVIEDRNSVVIPALGHSYESVVTAPTCTAQGYTTHTCPGCCDSYVDSYVDATGHSCSGVSVFAWDENYETCTAGFACETCGEQFTEKCEVTSHSEDATCTEPGTVTYTATVNVNGVTYRDEKTVENAPLGHLAGEAVRENEVPATCTTEGSYEEVVSCERCEAEISRTKKTVEKLPHTEETIPGKDASCTETGLTAGAKCSVCGEILTEQEEVSMLDHNFENGACTECGEEDPDYEEPVDPSEPEESEPTDPSEPDETDPTEPSEPEKPSKPSTGGSIIGKVVKKIKELIGAIICPKPEKPSEPTVPSEPEETEPTVPSEPEESEPTAPEETEPTTPGEPSKPSKPVRPTIPSIKDILEKIFWWIP